MEPDRRLPGDDVMAKKTQVRTGAGPVTSPDG
jgi:hypothetical protein